MQSSTSIWKSSQLVMPRRITCCHPTGQTTRYHCVLPLCRIHTQRKDTTHIEPSPDQRSLLLRLSQRDISPTLKNRACLWIVPIYTSLRNMLSSLKETSLKESLFLSYVLTWTLAVNSQTVPSVLRTPKSQNTAVYIHFRSGSRHSLIHFTKEMNPKSRSII